MNKILICEMNGKIINSQSLPETNSIIYKVFEDAPVIENREGLTGHYELGDNGNLIVVYAPIPKTEIDILKEKMAITELAINALMLV